MTLRLNTIAPAEGAKRDNLRLGRGIGSGVGKTGGRGVKGQNSRKSGGTRPGFEGGQTALYRRLPKFGFTSQLALKTAEVRLSELAKVEGDIVSLETLKAANVVRRDMTRARIVLSGDITRTEYKALLDLRKAQKPLILVFNKTDLYPDTDKAAIYSNLQQLAAGSSIKPLKPDEIVMVAAEPAPMEVRVEYADGKEDYEWEALPPQIEQLQQTILKILNREGRSLLSLNALVQARDAEESIAYKTVELREKEAEDLIWQYAKYKALAVGLNPIAFFDVCGGIAADLALIRSLSRLYGLPMTGYKAGKLLKIILFSSGGLLLGELGSSFLLGFGKSAIAISSGENPMNITAFAGTAVTQAGIAGYGAYSVGKAAKAYLEKGCSWGELGVSNVIEEILREVEPDTILYRLQQELGNW